MFSGKMFGVGKEGIERKIEIINMIRMGYLMFEFLAFFLLEVVLVEVERFFKEGSFKSLCVYVLEFFFFFDSS